LVLKINKASKMKILSPEICQLPNKKETQA